MATVTRTRPGVPANVDGIRPYKLSVRQFETMMGAGVFPAEARVELLGGVLAEQMTKNPPHDFTVGALSQALRTLVTPGGVVREGKTVILGPYWRPGPDIAVVTGPLGRYRRVHPRAKDLALLVEVAESTYPADRGEKWAGYAAAKVPSYWIVNLGHRTIEVYTAPVGRGKAARYREAGSYGEGDAVPVVIEGRAPGTIAVKDVLP